MTSFNETAIISYVESKIKDVRNEMDSTAPGEIEHDIILGKIEAS
jgi:hypothetical protein